MLFALTSPDALSGDRLGVGIEEDILLIEEKSFRWIIRSVDPVGILELLDIQPEHDHRIDAANPVFFREGDGRVRHILFSVEEEQLHSCPLLGFDRKVDAIRKYASPHQFIVARPYLKAIHLVQRKHLAMIHMIDRFGTLHSFASPEDSFCYNNI